MLDFSFFIKNTWKFYNPCHVLELFRDVSNAFEDLMQFSAIKPAPIGRQFSAYRRTKTKSIDFVLVKGNRRAVSTDV